MTLTYINKQCKESKKIFTTDLTHKTKRFCNVGCYGHWQRKNKSINSGCFKKGCIPHNKGNMYVNGNGYRVFKKGNKEIAEHRHVWASANNLPIPTGWVIHHADLNKNNNLPDNLIAMPVSIHNQLHWDIRRGVQFQ